MTRVPGRSAAPRAETGTPQRTHALSDVPTRMARWRYWLFTWMGRHEAPESDALGLPSARVVEVAQDVETD